MRALVTGATGFVGINLVSALVRKGYKVSCIVRTPQKAKKLPETAEAIIADVSDKKSLKPEYFRGTDVVFHVAGIVSSAYPREYFRVNYEGTKNIIDAMIEFGYRPKFIFTSSIAAVGPGKDLDPIRENSIPQPVDNYGKSKQKAEEYILLMKNLVNSVIIRPTAIYGPFDVALLPVFKAAEKIGFPIIRRAVISFVHVADVVKAHILAAERETKSGSIYQISDGEDYTFEEIFEIVSKIVKEQFSIKIRGITIYPEFLVALYYILRLIPAPLSERLNLISPDIVLRIAQRNWRCPIDKAQKELGFEPDFKAHEGLKQTIMWYVKGSIPA